MDALLCNSWLVLYVSGSDERVGSGLVRGQTQMIGAFSSVQDSSSSTDGEDVLQRRVSYNTYMHGYVHWAVDKENKDIRT